MSTGFGGGLRAWVGGFLMAVTCGCSGTDDGDESRGTERKPIDCGGLTCESDELCLVLESSPLGVEFETVFDCAKIPSECDDFGICDCEATEGEFNGMPVTGCSALGTRELQLTDNSCGTAPCQPGEGCIAFGTQLTGDDNVESNYCHPVPEGCEDASDFCDSDCARQLAAAAGETYQGCFWTRGISGVLVAE